jgi:hypothetical protein
MATAWAIDRAVGRSFGGQHIMIGHMSDTRSPIDAAVVNRRD